MDLCPQQQTHELFEGFRKEYKKIDTDPWILTSMCDLLAPYKYGEPCINEKVIMVQKSIGQASLFLGYIATEWTTLQKTYLHTHYIPNHTSIEIWRVRIIKSLLKLSFGVWNERIEQNNDRENEQEGTNVNTINSTIRTIMDQGDITVDPVDRYLFKTMKNDLFQSPTLVKGKWIESVRNSQERFATMVEFRQRQQPLITKYFH